MQLTPEQEAFVLEGIRKDIADRLWAKIENSAEDVVAFTVSRAAGMLDLSTAQFNRVLEESLDFGPRDRRVTLKQLRGISAKRTIKHLKHRSKK